MAINPLSFAAPYGFAPPVALGRMAHLGFVEIAKLVIDDIYQRPIDAHSRQHVLKIATHFDWSLFGALVVCPLGGEQFAIIDGQHRALAALICGIEKLPCIINFGDPRAQARAFAAINGQVKPVTLFNIYRAALAARETWALNACDVAATGGCTLMTVNRAVPERRAGEIYAIGFFKTLVQDGRDTLRCQSAVLALAALRMSRAGSQAAPYAAVPLQAWLCAVYQCSPARRATPVMLCQCLDAHQFLVIIDDAYRHVAARRDKGLPTVAVLEQLTMDLTGILDDRFDGKRRAAP